MDPRRWKSLLGDAPDPRRATHHLQILAEAADLAPLEAGPPEPRQLLINLLAASRWLTSLLRQHPDWIAEATDPDALRQPRRRQGLDREIDTLTALPDRTAALDGLHRLRQRELLRIAARDLARVAPLPEILLELSNAADVFLEGILRRITPELTERWGSPWHHDPDQRWTQTAFCVLGMGKLGGQELNYSSDVDLLFLYTDEGYSFRTPPKQRTSTSSAVLSNHAFFKRLAEALIHEASSRGVDVGALRIDMRLRPEGDAGPLVRSLDSYENFYAEWGQSWERMMLLKARGVAGSLSLAGEFIEVIHPFRYPRALGEGILHEMAAMKARLEQEIVRPGELDRNVKLGRGGIREIEFIAQSLQVLHAGRNPFLQSHQTLPALNKLAHYQLLPEADAHALSDAYRLLRDVEHRLQMDELRQTHTLPDDPAALDRIARLMGAPDRKAFARILRRHTSQVRSHYERVFQSDPAARPADPFPPTFDPPHTPTWLELLRHHRFRDPDQALRMVRAFLEGPGFGHVSRRTSELGRQLLARFLELCIPASAPAADAPEPRAADPSLTPSPDAPPFQLSDPDRVLVRLDSYIGNYGARASLYELWTARPNVFEHILKLFDRSEFLAELAIREPDLVDQLEAGAHLQRHKDAALTLADLRHGRDDPDQHLWLRRYFQTEFMRLGLRDILGLADFEHANRELTHLAEACIQYAVEVVTRRARLRTPPFAVIGLGKLGGAELVYGSDLDVIFVAPTDTRDLPRLQKLANEVIDLLATRTPQGAVFPLDTRLRPDGDKGLLVNTLQAHEDYYRQRALLWEIQALTRARAVAGHDATGRAFESLARCLTNFHTPSLPLAALQPGWDREIARMRRRIELERTPKGRDALAFKTGSGGLIDAEFLAQTLALQHGWFQPNTLLSLRHAADQHALTPDDATRLIANFRRLRHMESILRRWSFEGEAVLPDDPAALLRVATRCGYSATEPFLNDLARWRAEIREIYRRHLPAA
ncbi:MAG: bifunctional [glutamate--ammonia ligase]-adenylyl-L-tyrosine phosphorylase/[glutamate--ammonia-ligase] adenylyltransferase [Verrucomicrobiae bacterium]|nr:bifunctional [glutamate--ammonia ligase]-adenylyl-L-tyrosine phosphorylase/[glutamate--ammonia-ligase] adenylyltransferase [Verrucomicrobiae bacterium]